jgi:hypothetical protein
MLSHEVKDRKQLVRHLKVVLIAGEVKCDQNLVHHLAAAAGRAL